MRGKKAPRRVISPDPKFNSATIAKLVNYIMKNGKKSVAEGIVYDAFDIISKKSKQDPVVVFEQALKNITPQVEVRSKRVGGSNFQVPIEVRGDRKMALSFRWLLEAARSKKGKPMAYKFAEELLSASKGEGAAVKKKEEVHRMAESNRAFAHFA